MSKHQDIFDRLAAAFPREKIKQREGSFGKMLDYIEKETVIERLNEVVGPENWDLDLKPWGLDLIGTLTITLPDGSRVHRSDVGGRADMPKAEDAAKSAASDAIKRCGTLFGITAVSDDSGRPAYDAPRQPQRQPQSSQRDQSYQREQPPPAPRNQPQQREFDPRQPPRSGKALFAWLKDAEQRHSVELLRKINEFGKGEDFPGRIVDWSPEEVAAGHAEALHLLGEYESAPTVAPPRRVSNGERQAEGSVLALQKKKLINLLWQVARKNAGVPPGGGQPDSAWYFRAISDLETSESVAGELIPDQDVASCTNVALLGRYIEAAEAELALPSNL